MVARSDDFDDEPGDEGLRALVKMAREDFDEDPPPRIDALLMAAARQHAPAKKVGVFERMRRWMAASMLNPAIAGATALVVIGGTAGVLYMRNQGKVAQQPTVSRPAEQEAQIAPPAPATTEFSAQLDKLEQPVTPVETKPPDDPPLPDPEPKTKPRQRGGGGRDDRGGGDTIAAADGSGPRESLEGFGDGRVATGGVTTNMTDSPPPPPPPPPPPDDEERDHAGTDSEVVVATTAKTAESAPSNRSQVENLHKQARNAAKQKQCAGVKVMAQRTKTLDADYYANSFAKDPDIKPCL